MVYHLAACNERRRKRRRYLFDSLQTFKQNQVARRPWACNNLSSRPNGAIHLFHWCCRRSVPHRLQRRQPRKFRRSSTPAGAGVPGEGRTGDAVGSSRRTVKDSVCTSCRRRQQDGPWHRACGGLERAQGPRGSLSQLLCGSGGVGKT